MTTTLSELERVQPKRDTAPAPTSADRLEKTCWIVLDDDPTGTQSVRDLPVLTTWDVEDIRWALGTGHPAIYIQTNARSLDPDAAAGVMHEVTTAALQAAAESERDVEFVSRTDSTLRGHFPLDADVISRACRDADGSSDAGFDAVLLIPAFPEAGRVTVDGLHYVCDATGEAVPAGQTSFANDATFGYQASDLREWVEEKSSGAVPALDIVHVQLSTIRNGVKAVAEALGGVIDGGYVTFDAMTDNDLLVIAEAAHMRRESGARFLYRVGPPFVRALIGQTTTAPLSTREIAGMTSQYSSTQARGGLMIVGSHVSKTTRQLEALHGARRCTVVELDVREVLGADGSETIRSVVDETILGLTHGNVVVNTSRDRVLGTNEEESLRIARTVSDSLVAIVRAVIRKTPPRFMIAKGGITSSDIASRGLEIRRAIVRGPMLPGIVSMWEAVDGPAEGLPYIVFAGNVGDDESLCQVVQKMDAAVT